jgi:tetratricopeptide (TPR) repeat protein
MSVLFGAFRRKRPGHRLLLIFGVAILAPGLVLGFIGVRALVQEGLFLNGQIRERLDTAAELAGRRLESELNAWQQAAEDLGRSGAADPARWPERVRRAVATSGAAVVLTGSLEHAQVLPEGRLLYDLSHRSESDVVPVSPRLRQAELLELRDRKYGQAIELYREALRGARSPERQLILRGLAGALRNAGRHDQAIRVGGQGPGHAFRVSPDDSRVTFSGGRARLQRNEVWAIDHLMSALKTTR